MRVQMLNVKGKQKRHGQRLGKRQDWRKAYVRLQARSRHRLRRRRVSAAADSNG